MSDNQKESIPQDEISQAPDENNVSLVAKWGKKRITLADLHPATTILEVKEMLTEETNILPKRQKLIGLVSSSGGKVNDYNQVKDLKFKKIKSMQEFILVGTPEAEIFVSV